MRQIRDQADKALAEAVSEITGRGLLENVTGENLKTVPRFDVSQDPSRGDLSSVCALQLGKAGKTNPGKLAHIIAGQVSEKLSEVADEVKVEGPGFINVYLKDATYVDILRRIRAQGPDCGRCTDGKGIKVNVEFVSANPTGPLSVAHGRQAAVGDAIARVLDYTGFEVTREYFLNDTGNQINLLGRSIYARLLQAAGRPAELPEEGYQGTYISDMAGVIYEDDGARILELSAEDAAAELARAGMAVILRGIREDLDRFNVRFDVWSSQAELEKSGAVEDALRCMEKAGHTYTKDDAVWLKGTELGDFQDRVLVKADGSYTYRTPDIAYHRDKFNRGFDRVIDLWGPDHHGHIPSLTSGVKALGEDESRLDLRIVQQCTLWKEKVKVKMSTRAGTFVTLREVMDEVGEDAARYFFLMRKMDTHLDFDLQLAGRRSLENPVYYVQYAHARVAGISKHALRDERFSPEDFTDGLYSGPAGHLELLSSEDLKLIPVMARFPMEVEGAARNVDPQRITKYAYDLSAIFQRYYTLGKRHPSCRVITDDIELSRARLFLLAAYAEVLRAALRLLGVRAPESM